MRSTIALAGNRRVRACRARLCGWGDRGELDAVQKPVFPAGVVSCRDRPPRRAATYHSRPSVRVEVPLCSTAVISRMRIATANTAIHKMCIKPLTAGFIASRSVQVYA